MDFKLPFKVREKVVIEKFEGSLKDGGQQAPFETLVFEDERDIQHTIKGAGDGNST